MQVAGYQNALFEHRAIVMEARMGLEMRFRSQTSEASLDCSRPRGYPWSAQNVCVKIVRFYSGPRAGVPFAALTCRTIRRNVSDIYLTIASSPMPVSQKAARGDLWIRHTSKESRNPTSKIVNQELEVIDV